MNTIRRHNGEPGPDLEESARLNPLSTEAEAAVRDTELQEPTAGGDRGSSRR